MSRFDLDRLRVSNILEMQKEWIAKRNLAVAVRSSFGRKLIEDASFVFISPRVAITYQKTASQLDPTLLDESVAQPSGTMLPSWFSERFVLASRGISRVRPSPLYTMVQPPHILLLPLWKLRSLLS